MGSHPDRYRAPSSRRESAGEAGDGWDEPGEPDYFGGLPSGGESVADPGDAWDEPAAPDYFGVGEAATRLEESAPLQRPGGRRWMILGACIAALVGLGALLLVGALRGTDRGTAAAAPPSVGPQQTESPADSPSPRTSPPTKAPSATGSPSPTPTTESPAAEPDPTSGPGAATALLAIEELQVGREDGWNDYSRDYFGQTWADVDRNGCDQRNDVLNRDLEGVAHRRGTRGCVVESGTFRDPYSGDVIQFERGFRTSEKVQIDHVVALADAWRKGAQDWTAAQRQMFANDLLNLLASKGEVNQAKSADDASEWLPPNRDFHCPYVARQIAVKLKYDLRVTARERNSMVDVLSRCPTEPLPVDS